jgi:hypothetical protein
MHTVFFVGKLVGNRQLGRLRHRWEDVTMDHEEIGWGVLDWMHLAQDRGQWQALFEDGNEPSGSIKSGEFLD